MRTHFLLAAIALVLVAGTGTAAAQTVITRDAEPLQLTPAQRTTIYRTIVPQSRGRRPIVHERIVTERFAPPPVVNYDYRYDDAYAYQRAPVAPPVAAPPRAVYQDYGDYAYAVGDRVPPTVRLAPI